MDAALKTVAYLRVSTRSQDLANQKLAILEFSQKRRFPIDQFIESGSLQLKRYCAKNGTPEALDKSLIFSYTLAMGREQAGRGGL